MSALKKQEIGARIAVKAYKVQRRNVFMAASAGKSVQQVVQSARLIPNVSQDEFNVLKICA